MINKVYYSKNYLETGFGAEIPKKEYKKLNENLTFPKKFRTSYLTIVSI